MLLLVALTCFGAFIVGRVLASPELGAAVRGPDDGDSTTAIASKMSLLVATQFIGRQHAEIVLTEYDLTVLARAHNPNPSKYSNPEVRFRNSDILVSAGTTLGPLHTVLVAHLSVALTGVSSGDAQIQTQIAEVDAGRQFVPDFMRSMIDPQGTNALSLDALFNDSPSLHLLRSSLECVYVADDGLHLGFHRPGATPDPTDCVPSTAPVVSAAH